MRCVNDATRYNLKINMDDKAGVYVALKMLKHDLSDDEGVFAISEETDVDRVYVVYELILEGEYSGAVITWIEKTLNALNVSYILDKA